MREREPAPSIFLPRKTHPVSNSLLKPPQLFSVQYHCNLKKDDGRLYRRGVKQGLWGDDHEILIYGVPLVGLEYDETKVLSVTCSWRTASQLQYILTLECDLDDEGSNTYISRRLDVHRGQRVSIPGYRYKDSEIITHIPCLRQCAEGWLP